MSERTSYTPGTPCWVELSGTADIEASASFYGELFGWEVPELPNSAELGGYRRAKKGGKDVAGVSPRMEDGQPTVWATYVSVPDAAGTLAKAGEAGGTAIVEPMDVMGLGTMAVFSDPTGAVCGIWQPGTFQGAELVNEPGTVGWNELSTRDPEGAKAFYGAVFGWEANDLEMEDGSTYTEWRVGGQPVGGMLDMRGRMPDEVPPHWGVYFGTEDTDATVEKVKAGGGELLFGPMDIEPGRFATVKDPFGAFFNVMQPSEKLLARMAEEGK
ncbi:MAG TPA: VOC family protein [Solirubrobacterales bacterium]|nr:VOC family protein [Solirubrobacterales bacterium]